MFFKQEKDKEIQDEHRFPELAHSAPAKPKCSGDEGVSDDGSVSQ